MFGLIKSQNRKAIAPGIASALNTKYSATEMAAIDRFGTIVELAAGSVLTAEGRPGRETLLILEGSAAVSRDDEVIATVGAGDMVGEMAVVLGELRNATLVATSDVKLVVFTPREFNSLLSACPSIDAEVQQLVAARQTV